MTVAPVPGNGLPLFQARCTALVVIKLQLNCLDKGRRELSERCSKISALMSALGQKRTLRHVRVMSALPPKADMDQSGCDVRFVPIADIGGYSIISSASDGASLGVASIGPSKSDLRLSPLYDSNSK